MSKPTLQDEPILRRVGDSGGARHAAQNAGLNTQVYYNNDHASEDSVETAMSPRSVLRSGTAHCFEGAMFAYAVNFLHRHNPRFVLLEAGQDPDHNLVVVQDPQTGSYGANAHSAWPHLDGRPAQFQTVRTVAE